MRAARLAAGLLLAAAPALGQGGESASFVVRLGLDTVAVERFTRTPASLEGELVGALVGRMAYRVELGAAASTTALTLHAWRPGVAEDSAALQMVRLTLDDDSAVAEITTPSGAVTQRLAAVPGAVVYVNPSFALVEQIVLRSRELGGERVEVPLLLLQGGQSISAGVERLGPDSVAVTIATTVLRVAVSPDGRLLGGNAAAQNLSFERVAGSVPYAVAHVPPDYSAPEGAPYTAEEVTVATPAGHTLAGTLTRPAGPQRVPAVVTITGSGAQDRDQAIPILPGYRPMREIADTLSRRGIAVLRLDDRGTGRSGGDFAEATSADFADDVRAALAYLRSRPDVDGERLGVVGHSEGGVIGPLVAADDPALRAVVAIAGTALTGREIIHYQQRFALERALPAAQVDSAIAAARNELEEIAGRQAWIRWFLEHDPLPVARRVRAPVLILQGETDRQVTADQAGLLASAFREGGNRDVTVRVFPELNHLMLRDPDGDPARYSSLTDRRVDREVLGVLADWLAERLR
jgi:uncharacterized protein